MRYKDEIIKSLCLCASVFHYIFFSIFGNINSNSRLTDSSSESFDVSSESAGCSGASKGAEIPVNSLISPRRALAYKPFTSRRG